jgi:hypothetical protein
MHIQSLDDSHRDTGSIVPVSLQICRTTTNHRPRMSNPATATTLMSHTRINDVDMLYLSLPESLSKLTTHLSPDPLSPP